MAKTPAEILTDMERLANLAVPESNAPQEERDNAVRTLLKKLAQHKETLLAPSSQPRGGYGARQTHTQPDDDGPPPKPTGPSKVHERTERANEWRAFKKKNHLVESEADGPPEDDDYCNKCGKAGRDRIIVVHERGLGWTHKRCADWWWGADFSKAEKGDSPPEESSPPDFGSDDDNIPF